MAGLKNCLHVAARNDVHHITLPLLLVHHMEPVSQWGQASGCPTMNIARPVSGNDHPVVSEKSRTRLQMCKRFVNTVSHVCKIVCVCVYVCVCRVYVRESTVGKW